MTDQLKETPAQLWNSRLQKCILEVLRMHEVRQLKFGETHYEFKDKEGNNIVITIKQK